MKRTTIDSLQFPNSSRTLIAAILGTIIATGCTNTTRLELTMRDLPTGPMDAPQAFVTEEGNHLTIAINPARIADGVTVNTLCTIRSHTVECRFQGTTLTRMCLNPAPRDTVLLRDTSNNEEIAVNRFICTDPRKPDWIYCMDNTYICVE